MHIWCQLNSGSDGVALWQCATCWVRVRYTVGRLKPEIIRHFPTKDLKSLPRCSTKQRERYERYVAANIERARKAGGR